MDDDRQFTLANVMGAPPNLLQLTKRDGRLPVEYFAAACDALKFSRYQSMNDDVLFTLAILAAPGPADSGESVREQRFAL